MNTNNAPQISVIDPISPAIDRVKLLLFRPFDLRKWFVIGFCAWLAYLASNGISPGFNFFRGPGRAPFGPDQSFEQAKDFFIENLPWVIVIASIVIAMMVIVWLVVTWFSSRGRFMFLHCVAENKAEVKIPWTKLRRHANSLFLFRLVLGIVTFLVGSLFGLITVFLAVVSKTNGGFNVAPLIALAVSAFVFVLVFLAFFLIHKLTRDFVVPIMYLRAESCIAAWSEFRTILAANKANFALYILFQIVITAVICGILFAAALVTCCCAACIFSIPYIGAVAMLPLSTFKRAYSLYYLRQYGPHFDVFVPADRLQPPANAG